MSHRRKPKRGAKKTASPPKTPGLDPMLELLGRRGDSFADGFMKPLGQGGLADLFELASKMASELVEKDPELALQVASQSPFWLDSDGLGDGVMPAQPEADTLPVELEDPIAFDGTACLTSCNGKCCRKRGYLQIGIADILRIVSSPVAPELGIHSTADLFGREPPLLVSFFNSEYGLQLPYIRYRSEGSDPNVAPEDAPDCGCPFLFPIKDVARVHRIALPEGCAQDAHGCILLQHKPIVCRLSPLGALAGLETGKISYVYVPPTRNCPACKTKVTVTAEEFVRKAMLPGEVEEDRQVHEIMMATARKALSGSPKQRYGEVLRQLYNIDDLLIRNDRDLRERPGIERLVSIGVHAAQGDFAPYEALLKEFARA